MRRKYRRSRGRGKRPRAIAAKARAQARSVSAGEFRSGLVADQDLAEIRVERIGDPPVRRRAMGVAQRFTRVGAYLYRRLRETP